MKAGNIGMVLCVRHYNACHGLLDKCLLSFTYTPAHSWTCSMESTSSTMLNGRTLAVQPCGDVQLKHHSFQLAALKHKPCSALHSAEPAKPVSCWRCASKPLTLQTKVINALKRALLVSSPMPWHWA